VTESDVSYFGLIGVAGFVAPRHLKAIHETGNQLLAAVDPHDSVGILDRYFPEARFFTEIERFDRYLEKLRRDPQRPAVDYLSICSPNYLHDAHVRLALRLHAHAICEKPLVINPWNLDALAELESECGRRIYTILQLRLHPNLVALKRRLAADSHASRSQICLTYITRRGRWYEHSWKGSSEKSGGVLMNIGIHFLDALLWLFGDVEASDVHMLQSNKAAGRLELSRATVQWYLSVDGNDLPAGHVETGKAAYRSLSMDSEELDFTTGFEDLHTAAYREICAGDGFGIAEARPGIELVHAIRHSEITAPRTTKDLHPLLSK
jgi:UDP-N-acetyl-2-amino-2-deoxyglucuronate dehydrogenase